MNFHPIEVTTHNYLFHEDSGITSVDSVNNYIATSGQDGAVRIWNVKLTNGNTFYTADCFKTAVTSSIKLAFLREFKNLNAPVNVVRFYKSNSMVTTEEYDLCIGLEGGLIKLIQFKDEEEKFRMITVHKMSGDSCYDLCFIDRNKIMATFLSGEIKVFEITDSKVITRLKRKIHDEGIQGISYCPTNNLIATHAIDRRVKIHQFKNNELKKVGVIKKEIDTTHGISKRLLVTGDKLYVIGKDNSLIIYKIGESDTNRSNENENAKNTKGAPNSQSEHDMGKEITDCSVLIDTNRAYQKIGPFNAPIIKVIEDEGPDNSKFLVIFTKKSIYVMNNGEKVLYVDNAAYREITDGFFSNGIIFFSSMDGFLGSVRLFYKNALKE